MRKPKELLLFQNEIQTHIQNLDLIINQYIKKIKKEYSDILIEEKNKLLLKIAEGENLDINSLKSKYLKSKELSYDEKLSDSTVIEEPEALLEKITVDGITYYYENKEKGKVFDDKTKEIGIYKNSTFTFY